MGSINTKLTSKRQKNILVFVILLIVALLITARVVANSTINVLWKYQSGDYIVCQVEDTENGILKITDLSGEREFAIDLDIDDEVGGQTSPLTIKYPLLNGADGFKIWNTNNDSKTVRLSDISLNVRNAMTNDYGDIMSLAVTSKDCDITKIEYMDGDLIKTFPADTREWYEMIDLNRSDVEEIKIYTSDNENPAIISLTKDSIPPQLVYVYKNEDGKIAITAKAASGIYQITENNGDVLAQADYFATRNTFVVETTEDSVLIVSGIGRTTPVNIPEDTTDDEGVQAEVTYEEDDFYITISSETVGLWKITGDTENETDILLKRYQEDPSDVTFTVERDLGILSIKIYNIMGNYKEVVFDKTGPTIVWKYIKTGVDEEGEEYLDVVFSAQDLDSGLNCIKNKNDRLMEEFNDTKEPVEYKYSITNKTRKCT